MLLLALLIPQSADDLYRTLQARLRKAQTLQIEANTFYSDRGQTYRFQRPGRAHLNIQAVDVLTDGRRTQILDNGEFQNRTARKDDILRWMRLPGFESFYAPTAKVKATAVQRALDHPVGRLTVLELNIDGIPTTLYLSSATGLPVGVGKLHPNSPYFDLAYREVEINARFPSIVVPAHPIDE